MTGPRVFEALDETVRRFVDLADGDPQIVERICRDLCATINKTFVQTAINRDDLAGEFQTGRVAAWCNDLANFAEDYRTELGGAA
jgi:hypothetical protein